MKQRKIVNRMNMAWGIIFMLSLTFQAQVNSTEIETKNIQLDE